MKLMITGRLEAAGEGFTTGDSPRSEGIFG
jgi:hypothetical protein